MCILQRRKTDVVHKIGGIMKTLFKKVIRKGIVGVLTVSMLFQTAPAVWADEEDTDGGEIIAEGGVEQKLEELFEIYPDGSYFSVDGEACGHSSGSTCNNCKMGNIAETNFPELAAQMNSAYKNSWTCVGFAQFVYFYLFGHEVGKWGNADDFTDIGTDLSAAQPGDLIVYSGHEAIYIGNNQVYEANWGETNQVSIGHSAEKDRGIEAIYHANNYEEIDVPPYDGWEWDSEGWKYRDQDGNWYTNGWYEIGGENYCFDENGHRRSGWYLDPDGQWYWLDPETGIQQFAWIQDPEDNAWYWLDPETGAMQRGWITDTTNQYNKIYYMDSNGRMRKDQWISYNGNYYVLAPDGAVGMNGWWNAPAETESGFSDSVQWFVQPNTGEFINSPEYWRVNPNY